MRSSREKFAALREAEAAGIVADSMDVRKALMARFRDGELTLEQVKSEVKRITRNASKQGKITREQAFKDLEAAQRVATDASRERDGSKWARIADRLQELSAAEQNWDSYGACPMQMDALFATIGLLMSVVEAGCGAPFMTLTADGGIHLDWTADGRAVEVEIRSESDQCALFIDENLGNEEERLEFTGADVAKFLIV